MSRRFILVLIVLIGLPASGVLAGMLTLNSNAPSGTPLVVDHGAISGPLIISATNDTALDDAIDLLTGWQITLEIVADPGATGSLVFNSGVEPANYIFNGITHANFPGTLNTATRQLFSGASFAGGVQVATAPGVNLWQLNFEASLNASGTFGVFVVDGTDSLWTDAAANPQNRDFANVPDGDGPVRIGEIFVVPEPSSLAAWGIGVGTLGLFRRRTWHS